MYTVEGTNNLPSGREEKLHLNTHSGRTEREHELQPAKCQKKSESV
jgi:hypothetical protein